MPILLVQVIQIMQKSIQSILFPKKGSYFRPFNRLKGLTYDTFVRNRIDRAIEKIDKSLEYENKGMPYSALLEIKKVFSEV